VRLVEDMETEKEFVKYAKGWELWIVNVATVQATYQTRGKTKLETNRI
jgi:hypothetical protein